MLYIFIYIIVDIIIYLKYDIYLHTFD